MSGIYLSRLVVPVVMFGVTAVTGTAVAIDAEAIEGMKFVACLPQNLAMESIAERISDPRAVRACAEEMVRFVSDGG